MAREHGRLLDLLNDAFLAFFVAELVLRLAAYGRRPQDFFRNGWNVFDFVVVGAAFVPGLRENTTLLRLARLLRVVRVVRLLPDLRVLVLAIVRSLRPLVSMIVLTTLILFFYGMVGWILFADEDPQAWGAPPWTISSTSRRAPARPIRRPRPHGPRRATRRSPSHAARPAP